jgi:predicted ATP-dependent endonuclease of OLD family
MSKLADRIEMATAKRPKTPEGSFMKIAQALQPSLNEMFFTHIAILVEGISDIAYINGYMALTDRWDDFRRFGCHIVACDGKSAMVQPLAIAREMGIPTFTVCDGDQHDRDKPEKRASHERDNKAILRLCEVNDADPFPDQGVWESNLVMWPEEIEEAVISDLGRDKWVRLNQRVKTDHEITDVPGLCKNANFITLLLAQAWEDGLKVPSLDRLCKSILDFAADDNKNVVPSEGQL